MGIGGNALDTVLVEYPCVQGSINHLSTSLGGISVIFNGQGIMGQNSIMGLELFLP